MKFSILQENLEKAVVTASRFASPRAQLPILGNILLSATKSKLNISSTNLEISVSIAVGAKTEKEGEITIPSKILSELVSNLPKETINLEAEKEHLRVISSGFSGTVLGMNSSDFPKVPNSINKDKSLVLPKNDFSQALSQVVFATSLDETRPILTGVLFTFSKNTLSLVATDGFRLSQKKIKINENSQIKSLVLPKLVLSELSRTDQSDSEELYLSFEEKEKQAIFGLDDTILSSRLLEGEYPDFEKILPKSSDLKLLVDKEELLRGVKLASIFARDAANVIRLKVLKDSIKISAESSSSGSQETKVDSKVEGDSNSFEIAFNYKFLEDFLHSVKGEEVKMEFTTPDKAGVFTDTADSDYLHLIMPVKVQ